MAKLGSLNKDKFVLSTDNETLAASLAEDSTVVSFMSGSKVCSALSANYAGHAYFAEQLKESRIISLSGDVTGSVSFDGSENVTLTAEVVSNSHTHGTGTIIGFANDVKGIKVSNAVSADTALSANTILIGDEYKKVVLTSINVVTDIDTDGKPTKETYSVLSVVN